LIVHHKHYCLEKRMRIQKGSIAEFGPSLIVFLLIILFPIINLVGFACAAATVGFISRQTAHQAAVSPSYAVALKAVEREATFMANSCFGKFARLDPIGGVHGCGTDLYVHRTDVKTGEITTYGPNKSCPPPIDKNKYVYEYTTRVNYIVGPFVSMAKAPFVGDIPLVGKPASLNWFTSRLVEYPEGLVGSGFASGTEQPVLGGVDSDDGGHDYRREGGDRNPRCGPMGQSSSGASPGVDPGGNKLLPPAIDAQSHNF
jgi:hypothetical protein